jgi:hypothetical protein
MIGDVSFFGSCFPPNFAAPERVRFELPFSDWSESVDFRTLSLGSGLAATAVAGRVGRRYDAICAARRGFRRGGGRESVRTVLAAGGEKVQGVEGVKR